jgi:hypothetical protein
VLWDRSESGPSQDDETDATEQQSEDSQSASRTIGDAIKYGSLGGFVATVSMTVFRMPTSKSLPPTARFWATYVGSGDPDEYPVIALLLHLAYGVASGVFFALSSPGSGDSDAIAESKGALLGTVYGVLLSVFGMRVLLEWLLDTDPDTDERLVFHISHVVYGLTLGTWVGSRFGNDH